MKKRWIPLALCLCLLICLLPLQTRAEGEDAEVEIDKNALLSGLFEADIATVREAILAGVLTCEEVTRYYLERIEKYNAPYNCFITICTDAIEQAKQRDEALASGKGEGLLFGVPIVIKDNIDVAGIHTTNGYEKSDDQIAEDNAAAVQLLIDEGAVILAKTNMSTGAKEAHWSKSQVAGETKNAYNKYYSPGGSSGGSAVSVSLNFAAAALGTDTNSSLRLPAALAGCFSLRPTFDLISRDGVVLYNRSRDTVGAITRSAGDQVTMLDVLTGGRYDYAENLDPDALQGLRLGVIKELLYPTNKDSNRKEEYIDIEIAHAFTKAVGELEECGAEVVELSFSNIFSLSAKATNQSGMEEFYQAYLKVLSDNDVDALIFPTYLSTPLKSGRDENGEYWYVYDDTKQVLVNNCRNLASCGKLPELTIPIGNHSAGPGIGLEIAAPRNCEQMLLSIAVAYSGKYDHRVAPTGAPDDYIASSMGSLRNVLDDYYARLEAAKNPPTEPVTEPPVQPENTPSATPDILPTVVIALCAVGVFGAYLYVHQKKKEEDPEETPANHP